MPVTTFSMSFFLAINELTLRQYNIVGMAMAGNPHVQSDIPLFFPIQVHYPLLRLLEGNHQLVK